MTRRRPAPVAETARLSAAEKAEREEATVWIAGLDRLNLACGIRFCVDLSATPFYLQGSGYVEGAPFPWLVSDFGLVDAIESGIVKIPRLPVSDTTGRPEPKYFALWKHIAERLQPGERLPGGKPKPEVVWREAQDALITLASQWQERFHYAQQAAPGQEHTPPVIIIVCDNTDIAELFYHNTSGEETVEVASDEVQGEPPLLPLLNRYQPMGSTAAVDFKTVRPCYGTVKSHINQVVLDTTWEQSAAFRLEQAAVVACYARNDHLECVIPYEYLGASHGYMPDYLVRLTNGVTLFLEIKGFEDEQDRAKHQAAQRWVSAVNHWGQLGRWQFHVCRDPQMLGRELAWLVG